MAAVKRKIYDSVDSVVADVPDGASIIFGGFGGTGFPNGLIRALADKGTKNIHAISNNCGTEDFELGLLFKNRQIKHVVASFPGPRSFHFQEQWAKGEVTIELLPQGTLCERLRAAVAGIPAFYTPVGVGTEVAEGKEERVIRGKRYILEEAIAADYVFIRGYKADEIGNVVYRKASRNFNPVMAGAGKTTIIEVEEIVPVGTLDPETIVTPSIYIDRIVQAKAVYSA
jgi:3-oxoacid CoA-transferase subunit A